MSEPLEGLISPETRVRDSAAVLVTRDSEMGLEILLCQRQSTMTFFPTFWAFPGGGVRKEDRLFADQIDPLDEWGAARVCAARELLEETGWSPHNSGLSLSPPEERKEIEKRPSLWVDLIRSEHIPLKLARFRNFAERTTPPISPIRFANKWFHLHLDHNTDPSLLAEGEFSAFKWALPSEWITGWKRHEFRIPPPVIVILQSFSHSSKLIPSIPNAGESSPILFAHGVEVIPVRTATLPPATHTNAYLVSSPQGQAILIDPAARDEDGISSIEEAVRKHEATGGEIIAHLFTHGHSDHIGNISRLQEIIPAPIWGTRETADFAKISIDKYLEDAEIIILKGEEKIQWKVLVTPGHCPGHICLIGNAGLILGDMLAGAGTILIPEHGGIMEVYLAQLQRLADLDPHLGFPAHGPVIGELKQKIEDTIAHRLKREKMILDSIPKEGATLIEIAVNAYSDTPSAPPALACAQTKSHLSSLLRSEFVQTRFEKWYRK